MRSLLLFLALAALATAALPAQPTPVVGRDLLFTTAGTFPGFYLIAKDKSVFGTFTTNPGPGFPNWVEMWTDNQDFAVLFTANGGTIPHAFWQVDAQGVITTLVTPLWGSPNHTIPSEDGAVWLATLTGSNQIIAVPMAGGSHTTIAYVPYGYPNCCTLDQDTGDIMVGGSLSYPAPPTPPTPGSGWLLRYDRSGTLKSTIAKGLLRVSGVTPDLEQGGWFLSRFDQGGILHVSPQGQVTTVLASNTRNNCVKVDFDGTLWTVDVADITHFDRQGTIISKLTVPLNSPGLTGMALYGERYLFGSGVAKAGSRYTIQINSQVATEPSKPYLLAASLATRPGFKVGGGRWIHLRLDDVFSVSATGKLPWVFQNFSGQLNAFGRAVAAIALPTGFPPSTGIRVHVQGVILDPQAPNGISSVTNAIHLSLQ